MNRPYLETKIVKVRSEKKKEYCPRCGSEIIMEKAVGNWVNGECIDKIKFPCFCSFETGMKDYKRFGELDHVICRDFSFYRIRELKQVGKEEVSNCQYVKSFLKDIIETFDVHILKGKIIIFEEEK